MKEGPDISRIAALIGDPGRANILTALMAGQALTASELAAEAGVGLPTASSHLAKLRDGGLLIERKQGRHKYFALAGPDVATVLEALMGLSENTSVPRVRTGPKDAAMRHARVCYNHLAGATGVQLFDSLLARDFIELGPDGLRLSDQGAVFMAEFGVDVAGLQAARAPFCRECLDWSERRTHLAGSLGRAVFSRMEDNRWIRRDRDSRAVHFSQNGIAAFANAFPTMR